MSFLSDFRLGSVYSPAELMMLRAIYHDITRQPWFSSEPGQHEDFGRFILDAHRRGMVLPDKLREYCRVAARHKYCKQFQAAVPGTPIRHSGFSTQEAERLLARSRALLSQTADLLNPYVGRIAREPAESTQGDGAISDSIALP